MCSRHKSCVDIPLSSYTFRDFASFCFALDFIKFGLSFIITFFSSSSFSSTFFFVWRISSFDYQFYVCCVCMNVFFLSLVSMGTVIIFTMLYSKVAHHFTLIQYECVLYNICINHKNVLIDLLWNKNKTSRGVRCEQSFLFCNGLFFFSVLVGSQALSERQNASLHQLFRKIMRYSVTVHEDIERNQFFL